ncbi:MAG TPA: hypothetical protein VI160_10690 [Gemmatimonadales bacterium]
MDHESLVIVLSAGGAILGPEELASLPGASVTWARFEREGSAACLAARVRHDDPLPDFRSRLRGWGASRGWSVTVAPCGAPR